MTRQLTAREVSDIARTNTTPNNIPRSVRQIDTSIATSMLAGKVVPLAAFPLLREDTLRNSIMHAKVALMESAKVIKNPVQCRFQVWFIPFLAFERFNGGRDEFDRAYKKVAIADGSTVTPFFMSRVMGSVGSSEIMKSMGKHANPGDIINTCYEEAYNVMYNFRLRNRSETLYQSQKVNALTNTALQPAFWQHGQYKYVVPDWDDVAMEGAVDLTFTNPKALVEGLSMFGTPTGSWSAGGAGVYRTKFDQGATPNANGLTVGEGYTSAGLTARTVADASVAAGRVLDVYANMQSTGVKISLANIELAKKTQWYAEIKAQFEGIPDQWVVDMLMEGISVPDYMWKQPIKMADVTEIFGIQKRWATDGANLTDSVVNGYSVSTLDLAMPRCPTGGIVMVTAEILPEQLFERAADPLLFITDPDKLPNAMRDDLDPQKAERISNRQVDVAHSSPTGLFGYGPLNWPWQQPMICIGGKWFKSAPSTVFNEERQNFWTVEVANPALGTDFMIAKTFNQLPFVVTNQDIGEVEIEGTAIIEGNTVFGPALLENDNAYVEVLSKVDQTRIVKGV